MQPWNIELDAGGRSIIKHDVAPRFIAQWTTGEADLTAIEGVFWQNEGSGSGEDDITLHGFHWLDTPPDQAAFDSLMKQAALTIDDWIASRF
jgi:hypothetical protein